MRASSSAGRGYGPGGRGLARVDTGDDGAAPLLYWRGTYLPLDGRR